jgi:hypothetical protein
MLRLAQRVKPLLLSDQTSVGTIWFGLYRGIKTIGVPKDSVQIRFGLWERETYKYIRQAANRIQWMIDVGAGSGELSLYFALRTGAKHIIAVEPWTPDLLRKNITFNNCRSIEIIQNYLGTGPDHTKLDAVSVPRDLSGFIKIDADFAELDILRSGEALLGAAKPLLLVETHSASLERECIGFLFKLGYEVTIITNAWWRKFIPELRPLEHNRWLWAKPRSN